MVLGQGQGGREPWRPEKQAENKQIEGERREKQAEVEREARRAGGKLSVSRERGDGDRLGGNKWGEVERERGRRLSEIK